MVKYYEKADIKVYGLLQCSPIFLPLAKYFVTGFRNKIDASHNSKSL